MTTPNDPAETQRMAIETFDRACDGFQQAFAQVPDDALAYLPPGDEYALGVLPIHLAQSIRNYLTVLDLIEGADYAPVDLSGPEAAAIHDRQHAELVSRSPSPSERDAILANLDAAHRAMRERLVACDPATFVRAAPVTYSTGGDPYPTSAHAVACWLSDHYDEHTSQVGQMLAQWRASSP
jgi:hypothetical protein